MFNVNVKMQIHSCFASGSSGDVWLERAVLLPFVPFVGLYLEEGEWSDKIEEVSFNVETELFTCYVGSDEEFYQKGREIKSLWQASKEEMDRKVQEYTEEGWTLIK